MVDELKQNVGLSPHNRLWYEAEILWMGVPKLRAGDSLRCEGGKEGS